MFSSIVQAGMRAITPRSKRDKTTTSDLSNAPVSTASELQSDKGAMTTPQGMPPVGSQATIPTPSTVATEDGANQASPIESNHRGEEHLGKESKSVDGQSTTKTIAKEPIPVAEVWKVLDRQLRSNIGTSVRCGICLSTVTDPVRTPCAHGFCRECITGYLRASRQDKCPECKAYCSRRGLEDFQQLDEMADAYKGMLRAFGLAPGTYRPEITTMTQKVDLGLFQEETEDSEEARFHRLCVSATYQQQGIPRLCQGTIPKIQVEENNQVVQANYEACFEDDEIDPRAMEELLRSLHTREASKLGILPNTQEVNEQAREQLEADRELQESMEADELQKELKLQQQNIPSPHNNPNESACVHGTRDNVHANTTNEDSDDDDSHDSFVVLRRRGQRRASATKSSEKTANLQEATARACNSVPCLTKNPRDALSLSPSEASPPIFARAHTASKRHTRKSFSKWDRVDNTNEDTQSPPKTIHTALESALEEESLSPIEHENSYCWSSSKDVDPKPEGTGLLKEPASDGVGTIPIQDHERFNPESEKKTMGSGTPYKNDDDSDDKTIPITADGRNTSKKDNDEICDEATDGNSDTVTNGAIREQNNDLGSLHGDSIPPTQVTDELHQSTKIEIDKAASLPAGPEYRGGRRQRPAKKILFAQASNDEDDDRADLDRKPAVVDKTKAPEDNLQTSSKSSAQFPKGTIVNVQSRTWPGVNKQGGVGRITAANADGTYNVAYVLGGKESNVDAVFITKEDQGEEDTDERCRRRRRAKDDDGLPPELLRQLAEEGFHIPGQKSIGGVAKKRRKPSSTALSDTTNCAKPRGRKPDATKEQKSTANVSRVLYRKRKAPSTDLNVDGQEKSKNKRGERKIKFQETEQASSHKGDEDTVRKEVKKKKQVSWNVTKTEKTNQGKMKIETKDLSRTPNANQFIPITSDEAIKHADERYHRIIADAIQNKVVTIVSSNLGDEEKAMLKSLCSKKLDGDVSFNKTEVINKKTTICVVPASSNGVDQRNLRSSVRTLKVLRSCLAGLPIVTPDWLQLCNASNKVEIPTTFIRSMPTKDSLIKKSGNAEYGVAKLAAAWNTELKAPAQLPFRKTWIYFVGNYSADKRKNIQNLLRAGGAKILSSPKDLSLKLKGFAKSSSAKSIPNNLVILCGDGGVSIPKSMEREIQEAIECEVANQASSQDYPAQIKVVDSQWVVESVTCGKSMPPTFFEPKILKKQWILSV